LAIFIDFWPKKGMKSEDIFLLHCPLAIQEVCFSIICKTWALIAQQQSSEKRNKLNKNDGLR
jgi:hypothetical protein